MSTTFIEIITATIAAGEVKTYMVSGGYFEIIDAAYPVSVRLVDRYGTVRGQMNNAEASFYMKQGEFDAIEITSANAQAIRFAYGSSEAGTRRTSGVVQVVDAGQNRSIFGKSFVFSANKTGAAGFNPCVQLINKTSNKKAIVKAVYASSSVDAIVALYWKSADLPLVTDVAIVKKNYNSANSEMSVFSSAAVNVVPDVEFSITKFNVKAGNSFGFVFQDPVVLMPGVGIYLTSLAPASQLTSAIEFHEE